jgi:hypothetical protein
MYPVHALHAPLYEQIHPLVFSITTLRNLTGGYWLLDIHYSHLHGGSEQHRLWMFLQRTHNVPVVMIQQNSDCHENLHSPFPTKIPLSLTAILIATLYNHLNTLFHYLNWFSLHSDMFRHFTTSSSGSAPMFFLLIGSLCYLQLLHLSVFHYAYSKWSDG